jgi:branched-chain amino acid transport system permease protein
VRKIKRLIMEKKTWLVILGALVLLYPYIPLEEYYIEIGGYSLWLGVINNEYTLHVVVLIMLYMLLSTGLNIIPGYTGLLDLGFVGFYGIGAYTSGLLTVKFAAAAYPLGLLGSFWVIIFLAALNGALWGVLLGAPTLRLTGDYFAIVTFGFSELVILIILNEYEITNGPIGVRGISPPTIGAFEFASEKSFYYLIMAMLILTIIILKRLEKSKIGRAWFAIRENEIAAEAVGINIIRYKVTAFAISASIGAVGGAFFARWMLFISPDMFKFWESVLILCMIILGGLGSIRGVLAGALILTALSEILRSALPYAEELIRPIADVELVGARYAIYGLVLVIMMRFKPEGLLPETRVMAEMHPTSDTILEAQTETFWDKRNA